MDEIVSLPEAVPAVPEKKLLIFRLEEQVLGVPLFYAQECVELTEVTRIPQAPKALRGLFHRQGKTVSLVHAEPAVGKPIPDRLLSASAIILLIDGVLVAIPAQDIRPGSVTLHELNPHPQRGVFPAFDELHESGVSVLHPGRLLVVLKQNIQFKNPNSATHIQA